MLATRVPFMLMPLLSPRLPLVCMQLDCDDSCFTPEEPDESLGSSSNSKQPVLEGMSFISDELSVLSLPMEPNPSLSHFDVVEAVCRGLQCPNFPLADSGAMRLHNFATFECRVRSFAIETRVSS